LLPKIEDEDYQFLYTFCTIRQSVTIVALALTVTRILVFVYAMSVIYFMAVGTKCSIGARYLIQGEIRGVKLKHLQLAISHIFGNIPTEHARSGF
jgi:hypothetical protein